MKFSFADAMIDPAFLAPLASAAESAGFDGFVVPDSICYPEESDSVYPYTEDGSREFLEDKPFLEPFSLIPFLAATTSTIRFDTFVVKLPIRHPVLVAKQMTSVGVLTGNRFGFGIGVSPWPEDFAATDVEWARRGRRMDEMMEILRGLSTGEFFEYSGEIFDVQSMKMCPVPTTPVPLLVGGHSAPALRRAATLGDGWLHAGGGDESLEDMLDTLTRLREDAGRGSDPFEVHVISLDAYTPDGIERLDEAGVTNVIVGFRDAYQRAQDTQTLQEKIDAVNWYAETVIGPSRDR